MTGPRWRVTTADRTEHAIPQDDWIDHTADDNCLCEPTIEAVFGADGSCWWVAVHNALDNREENE